jgi:hypothetical protein
MASDLAGTAQEGTAQEGTAQEGTAQESAGDDLAGEAAQWLTQARALRDEIERVDDTLRDAAESAKLNPRALVRPSGAMPVTETTVALRGGLEAGRLVQLTPAGSESLESELAAELGEAHRLQDELADLLRPQARPGGPSEWPLRGEILAHVDRLRTGLNVEAIHHGTGPAGRGRRHRANSGSWPAARPSRLRPRGQLLRGASRSRSSAQRPR